MNGRSPIFQTIAHFCRMAASIYAACISQRLRSVEYRFAPRLADPVAQGLTSGSILIRDAPSEKNPTTQAGPRADLVAVARAA